MKHLQVQNNLHHIINSYAYNYIYICPRLAPSYIIYTMACTETDIQTDKQVEKQACRQADRQTDRQKDRQKDRQRIASYSLRVSERG